MSIVKSKRLRETTAKGRQAINPHKNIQCSSDADRRQLGNDSNLSARIRSLADLSPSSILTWKFPLPNWGCWGGLACVCCAKPGLALPKGLKRVLNELSPLRNGWKNVSARQEEKRGIC